MAVLLSAGRREALLRAGPNLRTLRGLLCSNLSREAPARGLSIKASATDPPPLKGVQKVRGVHVFECPDRLGIVSKLTELIASRGANILQVDVHIDENHTGTPTYFSRSEFDFDSALWPRESLNEDFAKLAEDFSAARSNVWVPGMDAKLRVSLLASQKDHCLVDLLYRWQQKEFPIEITSVISNHDRGVNSHVRRFLDRHHIPFHHFPISKGNKREEDILKVVDGTSDFLVLARYMQILSGGFLHSYGRDIINIHHGLLPSFKGANPYKQAFAAGVKLIGATSHFVTEGLDMGPIIEQKVEEVSHRDTLASFALKSERLETQCLADAIKYYAERRILRYSNNKTLVFL